MESGKTESPPVKREKKLRGPRGPYNTTIRRSEINAVVSEMKRDVVLLVKDMVKPAAEEVVVEYVCRNDASHRMRENAIFYVTDRHCVRCNCLMAPTVIKPEELPCTERQ